MPRLNWEVFQFYRMRAGRAAAGVRYTGWFRVGTSKKIGVEGGDPNLRFQPRLPGSVVGEASMPSVRKSDKITRVTGLR
jgi:hypothetical protein